jgi:hypothetical protein
MLLEMNRMVGVNLQVIKKEGEKKGEKLLQLPFPFTTKKIVIMILKNNHVPRFLRFWSTN